MWLVRYYVIQYLAKTHGGSRRHSGSNHHGKAKRYRDGETETLPASRNAAAKGENDVEENILYSRTLLYSTTGATTYSSLQPFKSFFTKDCPLSIISSPGRNKHTHTQNPTLISPVEWGIFFVNNITRKRLAQKESARKRTDYSFSPPLSPQRLSLINI